MLYEVITLSRKGMLRNIGASQRDKILISGRMTKLQTMACLRNIVTADRRHICDGIVIHGGDNSVNEGDLGSRFLNPLQKGTVGRWEFVWIGIELTMRLIPNRCPGI